MKKIEITKLQNGYLIFTEDVFGIKEYCFSSLKEVLEYTTKYFGDEYFN